MAENVGTIEYTVKADTAALLTAGRSVGSINRDMQKAFDQTDDSVSTLSASFGKLSSVASGVMAALSANEVIKYADAWTTLNNKLANSVSANEQLIDVTNRVFDISQETRTSVEATATLYGRLERATRKYNLSAEQLTQLTTTINKGLVVSGATTEEAASATIQLSQALASGVLRGEEFNSITENGSRLAQALADSLGVDIGQLRGMAAAGQLTTKTVVDGLLKQGVEIGNEFAKTTQTIGQAFTIATNNITKFVGESSTVQSTVAGISSAVVTVSENLDTLSNVFVALAAVMGSRFLGGLTAATTAMAKNAIASAAQAKAYAAEASAAEIAANSVVRKAAADKEAAISSMNLAQAEYNVAKGSLAEATALDNLIAKKSAATAASAELVVAEKAQAAAMATSATAARGASVAMNALKGTMAILGGPAGIIMIAAAALYSWYQSAQQAKEEAIALADNVDSLTESYTKLNHAQLEGTQAKLEASVIAQKEAIADLQDTVDDTSRVMEIYKKVLDNTSQDSPTYTRAQQNYEQAVRDNKVAVAELDTAQDKLAKTGGLLEKVNERLAGGLDILSQKAQQLKADMAAISQAPAESRSADGDKLLKQLEQENALLKITDKRQRAITAARQKAIDAGVASGSTQLKQIEEQAGALYDLQQAEKASASSAKASAKSSRDAEKERAKAAKEAQQELERKAKAGVSLVPEAAENAAYQKDVDDLNAALSQKMITQEQYNARSEALAAEHQQKLAKINAQQSVTPQQQAAGEVDPVQQLANENTQKIALIQQYEKARVISSQQADALIAASQTQYEQQRLAAIEQQYRAQSQLNDFTMSMIDAVGQRTTNAITGLITGTQTASDAVRNLASTILDQAVGALVQMGIQAVKNMVIGQTAAATSTAMAAATGASMAAAYAPAAAMASLASFGANAAAAQAGIASTVALTKGLALAGGRRYGGTTSSGNMYRVNESGEPEMFQSNGGKQYMMPTTSGKVVPASDVGGGSQMPIQLNIINQVSNAQPEVTQYDQEKRIATVVIKEVSRQLRSRTGDVSRALGDGWNVTGKSQ